MITTEARWVAWNMLDGNVMAGDVIQVGHREGRDLLNVVRVDGSTCAVPADKVRDATPDEIKAARAFYGIDSADDAEQATADMTKIDGYDIQVATARDHATSMNKTLYLYHCEGRWCLVRSTEFIPTECDVKAVPPATEPIERAWPGSAAYVEPTESTGLDPHDRLKLQTAITEYDRRQSRGRRYNPNALGLMLGALQDAERDVERGASLARALYDNFQDTLLSALERSVGLPLTYGGGGKSTGRPA